MKAFDLKQAMTFNSASHVKKVLHEAEGFKVLAVALEAGTSIPACVMHSHTVFYFSGGRGRIEVDGESTDINDGVVVVVSPGAARAVFADERILVVAVQIHESRAG